jgi:hypothetical protein
MAIHRRDFVKGMCAGTALLAWGFPTWAAAGRPVRRAGRCVLLLGTAGVDAAFERGAAAAFSQAGHEAWDAVRLQGGWLAEAGRLGGRLERSRWVRWVAVLDEASGAVFEELARSAGGRLLSRGSHAHADGGALPLRHAWLTASPDHGAAGILASRLLEGPSSFFVAESFLRGPSSSDASAAGSAPGFSSYRLSGGEPVHLHCSGLSLPEGCSMLGRSPSEGWTPLPSSGRRREPAAGGSGDWVEAVGYAVAASSLGGGAVSEACSSRAFVHRTGGGERVPEPRRFSSFVIDL